MPGRLYAVGVGPGDPELLTLKAARLIRSTPVLAYHSGTSGRSIARGVVADLVPPGVTEELLDYPVTTGRSADYYAAMADFYDTSAARLAAHLEAGRDVVVLAEGDPLFYSSFMYLHDRLADRFRCEVVPGVTSVSAAAAAAATPLVRHEDVLTVLPGTLPVAELTRRLADSDGAVVMKLGRTFPAVVEALRRSGRLADARYVERASTGNERVLPVDQVDPAAVPYFSLVLVPGRDRRADAAGRAVMRPAHVEGPEPAMRPEPVEGPASAMRREPVEGPAPAMRPEPVEGPRLLVVGLGPGPDRWLTPEVAAALGEVDHVVGYGPYVDRVPERPGLTRHASGNTVELERARSALDLALGGERVAVVSGGDAGVFGMAAAVFEAAEDPGYAAVRIEVLPGLTAAQAVAARAGAPLGGDYAVLSLSDRLKPWSVIEDRLRAAAGADLVLAIYNPASRTRTAQVKQAKEILLEHRAAETPVVVGRNVGRPGESLTVTPLGDLDPDTIDMSCLLIVGSSRTRAGGHGVWTARAADVG